jgi:hypothetical protein
MCRTGRPELRLHLLPAVWVGEVLVNHNGRLMIADCRLKSLATPTAGRRVWDRRLAVQSTIGNQQSAISP